MAPEDQEPKFEVLRTPSDLGLSTPEHNHRADVPGVAVPAAADARLIGAPVEHRQVVGVDDQAGGDETRKDVVAGRVKRLSVQCNQPVDLETGQALALVLSPHLTRHGAIDGVPVLADVEQVDVQLSARALGRFATWVIRDCPTVLGRVVGVLLAQLRHLVGDDLLDNRPVVKQAFVERQADARRGQRTSVVRQVDDAVQLRTGQTPAEVLIPLGVLLRVLGDGTPVDGRGRDQTLEQSQVRITVNSRQEMSIVANHPQQIAAFDDALHPVTVRIAELLLQLGDLVKGSRSRRHGCLPLCRLYLVADHPR